MRSYFVTQQRQVVTFCKFRPLKTVTKVLICANNSKLNYKRDEKSHINKYRCEFIQLMDGKQQVRGRISKLSFIMKH